MSSMVGFGKYLSFSFPIRLALHPQGEGTNLKNELLFILEKKKKKRAFKEYGPCKTKTEKRHNSDGEGQVIEKQFILGRTHTDPLH